MLHGLGKMALANLSYMKRIDETAFIRAYDEYADDIFRYCYFRTYDRERSKELMQEVFTRTWQYLQNGNEIENLRAFLYRTAHNMSANERARSKSFSLEEMEEVAGFEPASHDVSPEERSEHALLLRKLEELDEGHREVLTLRYLSGLPVSEIASLLKISPNTASVRIHRALKELRNVYTPS